MDIEVNYKNKKRYKTAKYPMRQPKFFTWLIWFLSKIVLSKEKYKVEKIDMEGVKPPFMMLSNHMHFIDFELAAMGTWPYRVNNVISIDGYYRRPWLMELIGGICTRKFTMDLHLVKSINKTLKRGDILSMYPEARYSPCGITSFMPEALGKIIKMNKIPVVAVLHHGNYLRAPFWNYREKRKVPMLTQFRQILTTEQVESMSVDEINRVVREALQYNEYEYQKKNNILITEPYRANGLHKILYQCPNCKTESQMGSNGVELFCKHCGKRWYFNADGTLTALKGKTEFRNIPDWFLWEKQNVQEQVENGTYHYEDEVEVYSFPRCWRFIKLGKAKLTHDINEGYILEGFYNKKPYRCQRRPEQINSLHVEYDFRYVKPFDAFDISSENDSFYVYPSKENVLTKLAFATEAIHQQWQRKLNPTKN